MAANPPTRGAPGTFVLDPATGQVAGTYDSQGVFRPGAQSVAQADERARVAMTNAITGAASTTPTSAAANAMPAGTAGAANSTTVPTGMAENTGFASRYAPGMIDQVYDSPETVLYDLFNQMGIGNQGSGIYQQLAQFGGADPLSLYFLQTGAGENSLGAQNANDYTNWLAAQYQNQALAGGAGFDFQNLMGNVFGMSADDTNPSVLYNLITAGTPTQQVSNLFNLARDAGRVSLNPLANSAMSTALQRAAQGYLSSSMQGAGNGADTPFFDYLRTQAPSLVGSFTGQ